MRILRGGVMRNRRMAAGAPWYLLTLISSLLVAPAGAQTAATPASIENSLTSQYSLTKTTADRSDIVTAGAVLVLKKDGLLMSSTTTSAAATNTYKDGRLTQGVWKVARMPGFGSLMSHTGQTAQTRTFVAGEKFWVTKSRFMRTASSSTCSAIPSRMFATIRP